MKEETKAFVIGAFLTTMIMLIWLVSHTIATELRLSPSYPVFDMVFSYCLFAFLWAVAWFSLGYWFGKKK